VNDDFGHRYGDRISHHDRSVANRLRSSLHSDWSRILVIGALTGSIGGLATFMWSHAALSPFGTKNAILLFIAGAGGFTHLLSPNGEASVKAFVIAFLIGWLTNWAAWESTILLIDGPVPHAQLLFLAMFKQAIASSWLTYNVTFIGGYFIVLVGSGLWSPGQ
jgi:hypothetical protein